MEDLKNCSSARTSMVTVILLGQRGSDRALVGNTMLGAECFKPEMSTFMRVVYHVAGQMCYIINTPDLYHGPKLNSEEKDVEELTLSFSGERVFLLILGDDHVSAEEVTMFAQLKETYGDAIVDKVIIVLVTGESKATPLERDQNIGRILEECGGRGCSFKWGMKKDELNDRLLSLFRGMLQKSIPDRLDGTLVEPCDKTSEKDEEQPEPDEEKPPTAAPERGKASPRVQETLDRCKKLSDKKLQEKKAQPTEEMPAGKEPAVLENRTYETIDESEGKPVSTKPAGKTFNNRIYENIDKTCRETLKEEEDQSETADENSATAEPDEEKVEERVSETTGISNNTQPEEEKAQHSPTEDAVADLLFSETNILTIVLLGQTGSGKSATGNTILGREHFESRASSTAITQQCEKAEGHICGMKVRVIDTPDFFDQDLKKPELHVQICKDLSQPGPVVYLLVMHMGRFTDGERETVSNIQKAFGEQVVRQTVILFTGKEKLKGMSLDDYVKNADTELQELVETFGSRYHAFNNNDKSRHQVKDLVRIIGNMPIGVNVREHYLRIKNRLDQKECRIL